MMLSSMVLTFIMISVKFLQLLKVLTAAAVLFFCCTKYELDFMYFLCLLISIAQLLLQSVGYREDERLILCRVGQSEMWWEGLFLGELLLWAIALIVERLLPRHPLQLTLMFEDRGVVTAHADFTSGSHSLYADNWVIAEVVDSLENAQDFLFPEANFGSILLPEQHLKSSKSPV